MGSDGNRQVTDAFMNLDVCYISNKAWWLKASHREPDWLLFHPGSTIYQLYILDTASVKINNDISNLLGCYED